MRAIQGLAAASLAALLAAGLAGCGSTCVAKGDRIVVDVVSGADLNDTGAGPQTVRYQVWAVRDRTMFDAARAEALASAEGVGTFERQGLGRAFVSDSNWIKPADRLSVVGLVDDDNQFAYVGIAVLFPTPQKAIVALDCSSHDGYTVVKPEHHVVFTLGRNTVQLLKAAP